MIALFTSLSSHALPTPTNGCGNGNFYRSNTGCQPCYNPTNGSFEKAIYYKYVPVSDGAAAEWYCLRTTAPAIQNQDLTYWGPAQSR